MKKFFIITLTCTALSLSIKAQIAEAETSCNPQPCYNNGCAIEQPYVTQEDVNTPCYIPEMGCGYENCDYPALVNRYAYLAHKYNTYGPSERQRAIADNNNEIIELQRLDNHFNTNIFPKGLNEDQKLQLRAAQGSIKR